MNQPIPNYALLHNACAVCERPLLEQITVWFANKHDTLCPPCFAWLGRMLRVVSIHGRYV